MDKSLFPLTSPQLDIWSDQILDPQLPLYNVGGYLCLYGKIDEKNFINAIRQLVAEQPVLRTLLSLEQGHPRQCFLEADDYIKQHLHYAFHDFSRCADPQQQALIWMQDYFSQPFRLYASSLNRFALLKTAANRYYYISVFHHIVVDGLSVTLCSQRLSELYSALCQQQTATPWQASEYRLFIDNDQHYRHSSRYQSDQSFWQNRLQAVTQPAFQPKQQHAGLVSHLHQQAIAYDIYQQLTTLADTLGGSIFHIFIAALYIYSRRLEPESDFIIGVPILNRNRFARSIGMFVSITPFQLKLDDELNIHALLSAIRTQLKQDYRHQRFPLSRIDKTQQLLLQQRSSLFNLILSYERQNLDHKFNGVACKAQQLYSDFSRAALALTVCEFHDGEDVNIDFVCQRNLFSDQEFSLFSQRFLTIIRHMRHDPQQSIAQLPCLSEQEYNRICPKAMETPPAKTFIQGFEQSCRDYPERQALTDGHSTYSYQQLAERVNRLAHYLIALGIGCDDIIALYLARSPDTIVWILATLKAGAAWLPLDHQQPQKRIDAILQQAKPARIVCQNQQQATTLQALGQIISCDSLDRLIADYPTTNPGLKPSAFALAYVIYTSGSSGQPKGVMIERHAIDKRLHWLQTQFNINHHDRFIQLIQLHFDPSVYEVLLPLISGACLRLSPAEQQPIRDTLALIAQEEISIITQLPSLMQHLLSALAELQCQHKLTLPHLKQCICGGEALSPELVRQFYQLLPHARLYNVYGPTEGVILASWWPCQANPQGTAIPIGYPLDNTCIYILDSTLQPCPQNTVGEICLGGSALARGYLQLEALTQQRFIPDPFSLTSGARMYRSGDLGKINSDGLLEIQGRMDRQVKIRGYRIELGDIEAALKSHPNIHDAAVVSKQQQLVAHLVTPTPISDSQILSYQQTLLPDYMLPSVIQHWDKLPLTRNGKTDYAVLQQHSQLQNEEDAAANLALNETQCQLMAIWQHILPREHIGLHDSFFALGGDSLNALSVLLEVEKQLNIEIPLSQFLLQPTIAGLEELLQSNAQPLNQNLLLRLSQHKQAPRFYCIASGEGDISRFSRLAEALSPHISMVMLKPPNKPVELSTLGASYSRLILQDMAPYRETPCIVGGFSIGGILALEVATSLQQAGITTAPPVLIDTVYPHLVKTASLVMRLLPHISHLPLIKRIHINGRYLNTLSADHGLSGQIHALKHYRPSNYAGSALLIKTQLMSQFSFLFYRRWSRLIQQLTTQIIQGFHGEIFREPYLAQLAAVLLEHYRAPSSIDKLAQQAANPQAYTADAGVATIPAQPGHGDNPLP